MNSGDKITKTASRTGTERLHFSLKIASRCNLNCHYCYVYNKGDDTWKDRPPMMSKSVFLSAIERIYEHCLISGQGFVNIVFHGGEPTLIGALKFAEFCELLRQKFSDRPAARLFLQTNGTLIDEKWIEVLKRYDVTLSISMDGPADIHDLARVDHKGVGSYARIEKTIELLRSHGIPITLLCVLNFEVDSLRVHRHFLNMGVEAIQYILPDYTHNDIDPVYKQFGDSPSFDYLNPILKDWWENGFLFTQVEPFNEMARMILGGVSRIDYFGNLPLSFLFVETDGSIEMLDVLKICGSGFPSTGLNVVENSFSEVANLSRRHRAVVFDGISLSKKCQNCKEGITCGGGYLPHRFSKINGFDNPSVWCRDILKLFDQLRSLLDVDTSETRRRREEIESREIEFERSELEFKRSGV